MISLLRNWYEDVMNWIDYINWKYGEDLFWFTVLVVVGNIIID